jgi:uncharacterized protein (DUF1499 family)
MPLEAALPIACGSLLGTVLVLTLLRLLSRGPSTFGPVNGRLRPCDRPGNCVCSQDAGPVNVYPFRFADEPDAAWARLRAVLADWPRTRVVADADGYLHAECRSLVFRFVDDLECLLDREARVIHVRSASRAGRWDVGVNRKRVEALRRALAQPAS